MSEETKRLEQLEATDVFRYDGCFMIKSKEFRTGSRRQACYVFGSGALFWLEPKTKVEPIDYLVLPTDETYEPNKVVRKSQYEDVEKSRNLMFKTAMGMVFTIMRHAPEITLHLFLTLKNILDEEEQKQLESEVFKLSKEVYGLSEQDITESVEKFRDEYGLDIDIGVGE